MLLPQVMAVATLAVATLAVATLAVAHRVVVVRSTVLGCAVIRLCGELSVVVAACAAEYAWGQLCTSATPSIP